MAREDGATASSVKSPFTGRAQAMSFFQLVQLLERYHRPSTPVGGIGPAVGEVIRFRPECSLAFPAADVSRLEKTSEVPNRFQITTTFFGLYGTTSPLPAFYSEQILWREQSGDNQAARDFLDLFHHRLLSLLYRSWLKYRYHLQFQSGGIDEFSQRVFALIGFGTEGLQRREQGVPSVPLLRYAGLLTQRPRSASALEGMLSDEFGGIPVRVEQCVGRWTMIKPEQRSRLGGLHARLGQTSLLGEQVNGRSGYFRISLGPLSYEDFQRFFPGEDHFRHLHFLVRLFVGNALAFDVELVLYGTEVPALRLTGDKQRSRLGWSTWLATHNGSRQPMKVVFPMETEPAVGTC